ncbi:hypothetical protein GCM10027037_35780 [Mucilaginibacter koreensis]
MLKSGLFKKACLLFLTGSLCTALFSFYHPDADEEQLINWSNKCLLHWFNPDNGLKLKKWELTLTGDCFLRFKKYYQTGKQEYYSFHLRRFKELDYLGTATAGTLRLSAQADDIIVQTYNDPKGNIDSMSTTVDIPVRDVAPEQLDSLRMSLIELKEKHTLK